MCPRKCWIFGPTTLCRIMVSSAVIKASIFVFSLLEEQISGLSNCRNLYITDTRACNVSMLVYMEMTSIIAKRVAVESISEWCICHKQVYM